MKVGDMVRVELIVKGFGELIWVDEIIEHPYMKTDWYILKNSKIGIWSNCLKPIDDTIPEGTRVEMWKTGIEDRAYMGWYISYNRITGRHIVSAIKNKIEGRQEWDCVRRIDAEVANEILKGKE